VAGLNAPNYVAGLIKTYYSEPYEAPDGLIDSYVEKDVCASVEACFPLITLILKPRGFYWSAYGF